MNDLYAMRRANGDWFAFDDHGRFRMPVFHSSKAAMDTRSRHSELECFRPMSLNLSAVEALKTQDGSAPCFWIVDDPSINVKRSRSLDFEQFIQLMQDNGTV